VVRRDEPCQQQRRDHTGRWRPHHCRRTGQRQPGEPGRDRPASTMKISQEADGSNLQHMLADLGAGP
jgi:hypothetical protein